MSLTRAKVEQTAASIAAMQEPSGAIPWTPGEHTDVWNHLESAMALMVGGQRDAAERAFAWARANQRADGSWSPHTTFEFSVSAASRRSGRPGRGGRRGRR